MKRNKLKIFSIAFVSTASLAVPFLIIMLSNPNTSPIDMESLVFLLTLASLAALAALIYFIAIKGKVSLHKYIKVYEGFKKNYPVVCLDAKQYGFSYSILTADSNNIKLWKLNNNQPVLVHEWPLNEVEITKQDTRPSFLQYGSPISGLNIKHQNKELNFYPYKEYDINKVSIFAN